jgi:glucose-1-phosphate adenylyltransferase
MDIFVLSKKWLREQVQEHIAHALYHMDRDLVLGMFHKDPESINVYQFKGLAMYNESVEEYFQNSMALTKKEVREDLFHYNHPVYTKVRDRVPTYYGEDCEIENCIVADGCMLEGEAEDSVLFRQVTIEAGAEVDHCIIMNDAIVGAGSELKYVILDKNVTVRPGSKLIGTATNPIIVRRGETV